nr:importin-beta domain, armadillo-type fold protein [Tanacetum cinerariifolium]
MTKVIKEEFEKLGLLVMDDDLFTYDTQLGMIFDEFYRLNKIDNDLFPYKIEVPKPSRCEEQTSNPTHNDLMKYEWKISYEECKKIYAEAMIFINKRLVRLIDVTVEQWLDLRYRNHMTMDENVKKGARGDDEVELFDNDSSDLSKENLIDENEVVEIFRIETNDEYDNTTHNLEESKYEKEQHKEKCELFKDTTHDAPVCKIRRFEIIRYSFGQDEECVSVKECEYFDSTRTNEDACQAYQEIFHSIDEGWVKIGSDSVARNPDAVNPPNLLKDSFDSVTLTASLVVMTSSLVTSDGFAGDPDAVFTLNDLEKVYKMTPHQLTVSSTGN